MASRELRLLRSKRKGQLAGVLALSVLALTGFTCKAPSVPERVAGAGDSVGYNAKEDFDEPWLQTVDSNFFPGAKAGNVLPWVKDIVADSKRSPSCLIIEFGQNEAGDGVISSQEQNDLMEMTFAANKTTRVVFIEPWRVGGTSAQLAAIDTWRSLEDQFAAARPNTVKMDWKLTVDEHPEYLRDGVHLASAEAAEAFATLMHTGCIV
jgi:hypothetical protein